MAGASITIINRLGLHARAAAKFVNLAKTFQSKVTLTKAGKSVDGKSIMNVMLLAAPVGTDIEIMVRGADEREAFMALVELVNNRFGESD